MVIEARGLDKTFRVPEHRIDSLKERVTASAHAARSTASCAPCATSPSTSTGASSSASSGRNGSGKSSLLKILASIYRADAGTIRMAGRVAPFIELGVGFNPELTARENVRPQRRDDGPEPARGAPAGSTPCSSSPSSRSSSSSS